MVAADPVVADPVVADPVAADPVVADPVVAVDLVAVAMGVAADPVALGAELLAARAGLLAARGYSGYVSSQLAWDADATSLGLHAVRSALGLGDQRVAHGRRVRDRRTSAQACPDRQGCRRGKYAWSRSAGENDERYFAARRSLSPFDLVNCFRFIDLLGRVREQFRR